MKEQGGIPWHVWASVSFVIAVITCNMILNDFVIVKLAERVSAFERQPVVIQYRYVTEHGVSDSLFIARDDTIGSYLE